MPELTVGQSINKALSLILEKNQTAFLAGEDIGIYCLLYTSPSPRDAHESRMPSSA